jgi:hypothetical protein
MRGVPQRIMPRHLPAIILLLLPNFGHAQDTLPYFMADHLYFGPARYENAVPHGLKTADRTLLTDTTRVHYRMVWQEDQHGGRNRLHRTPS